MFAHRKKIVAAVCVSLAVIAVGISQAFKQVEPAPTPKVETLLPAGAVVYLGWDGQDAHQKAFEKTAAYEALYRTGLIDIFTKVISHIGQQATNDNAARKLLTKTYRKVYGKGLSLAVSIEAGAGPPKPQVTLVLHEGADLEASLSKAVQQVLGDELTFEQKKINGRTVTRAVIPAPAPFEIEIGWWKEDKHLVIAGGGNAISAAIEVATGKRPNITTNPLWKKYRASEKDFELSTIGWFDLGALKKMFGQMPIPAPGAQRGLTVNKVLETLGLNNVGAIVTRAGYRGRALWSTTTLEAPGERKGLLAFGDQKQIGFDDLPPLPKQATGFYACSVDFSKGYTGVLSLIKNVAKLGPEGASVQVETVIEQIPAIAGFDPNDDLLKAFGNVACIYGDPGQGAFGLGVGAVVQVKDADKLRKTLDDLLVRLGDVVPKKDFKVVRTKKQGREFVTLEIAGGMANPTFVIDKNWFAIGLFPQTVEAFLLRVDGRLPKWAPGPEYRAALADLPKQFTSIAVSDPRETYKMLVGLAPILAPLAKMGLKQAGLKGDLPFSVADFPPAELVTQKLFPNISVCTVDEKGFHCTSRTSLPSVPLLGGGSSMTTVAVMAALLLPAIQQARQAARRSVSKNNLRQLGLASHNYHETYNHFPQGLHPNANLKPEKRFSWMAAILPYMEQNALYRNLDLKKAWDAKGNARFTKLHIPSYLNPGIGLDKPTSGQSHYVGIAGVGKGAELLALPSKRAGVFGYNRKTRFRDITDGTANTMMITEASKNFGFWGAGGKVTIRALTTKPYINGPDGIGGPFNGGCHVLFADCSVRFISKNINSNIFESLSTIQGGEVVGGF